MKRKNLYAAGKKLIPDYIQMTELIGRGLDLSFKFKGKRFLIEMHETFTIWEMETDIYWEYATIDDFKENAAIEGVKLRDIWDKVSYIRYEC